MGRGVGISTGDSRSGLGDALLGADDVHDALLARLEVEVGHAKVVAVRANGINHLSGERVGWLVLVFGGNDVIDGGKGALGVFYF